MYLQDHEGCQLIFGSNCGFAERRIDGLKSLQEQHLIRVKTSTACYMYASATDQILETQDPLKANQQRKQEVGGGV